MRVRHKRAGLGNPTPLCPRPRLRQLPSSRWPVSPPPQPLLLPLPQPLPRPQPLLPPPPLLPPLRTRPPLSLLSCSHPRRDTPHSLTQRRPCPPRKRCSTRLSTHPSIILLSTTSTLPRMAATRLPRNTSRSIMARRRCLRLRMLPAWTPSTWEAGCRTHPLRARTAAEAWARRHRSTKGGLLHNLKRLCRTSPKWGSIRTKCEVWCSGSRALERMLT
mmetsp:Transcript_32282/g.62075  ORF Transcript_32282/g.62075 Transcript_32282/m.62075 type:complete len:218 (-) Transcript_32282:366-1019(-)